MALVSTAANWTKPKELSISWKNKTSNSWAAAFFGEAGFSFSDALASAFIKWHFPLQCMAGLALLTQSTFEI